MKKKQPKQKRGVGLTKAEVLWAAKKAEQAAMRWGSAGIIKEDSYQRENCEKVAQTDTLIATLLRKHAETMGEGS